MMLKLLRLFCILYIVIWYLITMDVLFVRFWFYLLIITYDIVNHYFIVFCIFVNCLYKTKIIQDKGNNRLHFKLHFGVGFCFLFFENEFFCYLYSLCFGVLIHSYHESSYYIVLPVVLSTIFEGGIIGRNDRLFLLILSCSLALANNISGICIDCWIWVLFNKCYGHQYNSYSRSIHLKQKKLYKKQS